MRHWSEAHIHVGHKRELCIKLYMTIALFGYIQDKGQRPESRLHVGISSPFPGVIFILDFGFRCRFASNSGGAFSNRSLSQTPTNARVTR